jgi:hypothetical protein
MYRVNEFLTPTERLDAMRLGGLRKLASMGLRPSDLEKVAASNTSAIDTLGAAIRTSVLFGAPLGAVWYVLSSGLKKDSKKTKKLKAELDHYNNAVSDSKNRLAGQFVVR